MSDDTVFCDICGIAQKSVRGLAIHKGRMHADAPISEPIAEATFDQPPVQVIPKVDAIIAQSTENDMEEPVNDDEMYPSAMDFPKVDPSILGIREVLLGSLVKLTNAATTWRIENGQAILATLAEPIPCTVKHRYLSNDVWTLYLEANGASNLFLLCLEQDVLNGCHMLGRLGAPVEALPKDLPNPTTQVVEQAVETPIEAPVAAHVEAVVAEEVIGQENAQELDEIISDVRTDFEKAVKNATSELINTPRMSVVEEISASEMEMPPVFEAKNCTTSDSLYYSASELAEVVEEVIEEKVDGVFECAVEERDTPELLNNAHVPYLERRDCLTSLNIVHNVAISYIQFLIRLSGTNTINQVMDPHVNMRSFCAGAYCLVGIAAQDEFGNVEMFISCVSEVIRTKLQISSTR